MSKYKVREGAPAVSLNKKVYLPGETLPDGLEEESVEQLLKTGAIEEVTESETKTSTEEETKLPEKDVDDPDKRADKTTTGGVPVVEQKPASDTEGSKSATSTTASQKSTTSQKPSPK